MVWAPAAAQDRPDVAVLGQVGADQRVRGGWRTAIVRLLYIHTYVCKQCQKLASRRRADVESWVYVDRTHSSQISDSSAWPSEIWSQLGQPVATNALGQW